MIEPPPRSKGLTLFVVALALAVAARLLNLI